MAPQLLIVDDDPAIRDLAAAVLADEGYRVGTAADGLAALAAVDAWRPDVIVSDIAMPRLTGLGLLHTLRARGDGTPFVLMSAGQVGAAQPGVAFVAKPFDLDDLTAAVAQALDGHASAGTDAPVLVQAA